MRAFVHRWWIFACAPLGALVGWWSGHIGLPDWLTALAVIAVTLSVCGVLHWRFAVWRRRALAELADMEQRRRTG